MPVTMLRNTETGAKRIFKKKFKITLFNLKTMGMLVTF